MAPATRRKRPSADTDADPAPVPAKQARKTRGQTAIEAKAEAESIDVADHDQASEPEVKKPAPRKGRNKATAKAEPVDDEEADATEPTKAKAAPKKGRSKAKADPTKDEQADEAESDEKTKTALKKGRGKSKVKEEPTEDDELDDAEATKSAPKKGRGKAKVKDEPIEEQADDVKPKKEAKATTDFKEAQVAKAGTSHIPLDDGCHLTSYHVYVDPDNQLIYDASLNQTNAGHNNNKFYRVQLLENGADYKTWTRWGRVGERGQSAVLGSGSLDDALKNFEKKFKDKSGLKWADRGGKPKAGKYVFVERSYDPDSDEEGDEQYAAKADAERERDDYTPPKCTLQPPVQSLMELIFNTSYFEATMAALNYDSAKLPLGKLSKATITRGYQALKELSDLLDDPSLAKNYDMSAPQATEHLSNLYYSTIPHSFGRNRPPIIQTNEQLKREIELLESLTDLKDADLIMKKEKKTDDIHPLDSRFKSLGMEEMTPLETGSDEFSGISDYLLKTCGATHHVNYEVIDIFRIQRDGEEKRFQDSEFSKVDSDRRLLWHGSRATNYGGILGQGLRIAPKEAPVNGYMFDKGIYLADMSSKSANYCCPYNSGGQALLLLCEAELGNPMQVLTNAQYDAGFTAAQQGMISTWGQGLTAPKGLKDAGCLHPSLAGTKMPDTTQNPGATGVNGAYLQYNEFICYDVAQVRLRYLLRVKM